MANFARPMLSEMALKVVVFVDDAVLAQAQKRAPDLMDWISDSIDAPDMQPQFVTHSLRSVSAKYGGLCWAGDAASAERALNVAFPDIAVSDAPAPHDYSALVDALQTHPKDDWVQVPVRDETAALRLRLAVSESGRTQRVLAIGAPVPGWPTLDPGVATWTEIDVSGLSGEEAAARDCERAALSTIDRALEARVNALAGKGSQPLLREILAGDEQRFLWRTLRRWARAALKRKDGSAAHLIAAWVDRDLDVPTVAANHPLAVVALSGVLRTGSADSEAVAIAKRMNWHDLAERWDPTLRLAARLSRLNQAGRYAEAVALVEAELGGLDRMEDASARVCQMTAYALGYCNQFEAAERILRAALEPLGAGSLDAAGLQDTLAWLLAEQERYAEAEPSARKALASYEVHAQVLAIIVSACGLSRILDGLKRHGEALAALERVRPLLDTPGNPRSVEATFYHHLGNVYDSQQEYGQAEAALRSCMKIVSETSGKGHPNYGSNLHLLALAVSGQGRSKEAIGLQTEALRIKAISPGKAHSDYAASLAHLATLNAEIGKYGRAERLQRQAASIYQRAYGATHPAAIGALMRFAAYLGRRKPSQAARVALEAWRGLEVTLGPSHPETQAARQVAFAFGAPSLIPS